MREIAQFAVMDGKLQRLRELSSPGARCADGETVPGLVNTILTTAPLLLLKVVAAITEIIRTNKSVALLAEWKAVFDKLYTCLAYVNPTIRVNGSHELFYKDVVEAMVAMSDVLKAEFDTVYKSGRSDTLTQYMYLCYNPLLFFNFITLARVTQQLADVFLDELSIASSLISASYSDDMEISVRKTANFNEYIIRIDGIDITQDCGNAIASILLSVEDLDEQRSASVSGGCIIALNIPMMYLHFLRDKLGAEAIAMTKMFELNYWTPYTIRAVEHAIAMLRKNLDLYVRHASVLLRALGTLVVLNSPGSLQLYKKIVTLFFDCIERLHMNSIRNGSVLVELLTLLSLDMDSTPEEYRVHEILAERQRALTLRDYTIDSNSSELLEFYYSLQERIRSQKKGELKAVFAYMP